MSHVFSNLGGLVYFDSKYATINFSGAMSITNFQSNRTAAFLYYKSDNNLIVKNLYSKSTICKTDGCLIFSDSSIGNITLQNITSSGFDSSYVSRLYKGNMI